MKRDVKNIIFLFLMFSIGLSSYEVRAAKVIDVSKFNVEMKITPDSKTREKTYLNGEWDFYPVKNVKWYDAPDHLPEKDVKWEKIIVPSDWNSTTRSKMSYHKFRNYDYPAHWTDSPAAWYRREVFITKAMAGNRILLDFKAVDHYAWIYVNGKYAGEHEDGVVPFKIDITKLVEYEKNNIIHVYVMDNSTAVNEAMNGKAPGFARYKRRIFII